MSLIDGILDCLNCENYSGSYTPPGNCYPRAAQEQTKCRGHRRENVRELVGQRMEIDIEAQTVQLLAEFCGVQQDTEIDVQGYGYKGEGFR